MADEWSAKPVKIDLVATPLMACKNPLFECMKDELLSFWKRSEPGRMWIVGQADSVY